MMVKRAARSLTLAAALVAVSAPRALAQFCSNCIFNSAAPQNAVFNVTAGTIRGLLTVGELSISTVSASTITATNAFIGPGSFITALNASQLTLGTVPSARLTGGYTGITGVGTLTAGVWQGTPVGVQYGGTGQNFVTASTGSILYFDNVGHLAVLPPNTAGKLLQTNGGAAAPSWTATPQILGANVTNIPLANLQNGTLPHGIAVDTNSIANTNGAGVLGNIPGGAAFLTIPLPVSNLAGGTLPTSNAASSVTVTGVTPGVYGGPLTIPQFNVHSDGRIYIVSQSTISLPPPQLSTGTMPLYVKVDPSTILPGALGPAVIASSLNVTGVTPGSYGDATRTLTATVGGDGRLSALAQVLIALPAGQLTAGTVPSGVVVPPARIDNGFLGAGVVASSLNATGVAPGTYGSATNAVQLTVGVDGRVSSLTAFAIPGASTSTALTDVDNAWSHAQTSFSSWTFINITVNGPIFTQDLLASGTVQANMFVGDGAGLDHVAAFSLQSSTRIVDTPATVVTVTANPPSTFIKVADVTGFTAGMGVRVDYGGPHQEDLVIDHPDGILSFLFFTTQISSTHAPGETIQQLLLGENVVVKGSSQPIPGEVLTAVDNTHAEWLAPPFTHGGTMDGPLVITAVGDGVYGLTTSTGIWIQDGGLTLADGSIIYSTSQFTSSSGPCSSSGTFAVLCQGENNHIYNAIGTPNTHGVVAGGQNNIGAADGNGGYNVISGGYNNLVYRSFGTVSGGRDNIAGYTATVGGGISNVAGASNVGDYSTIAGGNTNTAGPGTAATVGGGASNTASGSGTFIGGGGGNVASASNGAIAGGLSNHALHTQTFIGGGQNNYVTATFGVIAGGQENTVSADFGSIGSGFQNIVSAAVAAVGSGDRNAATAGWAYVGGGKFNVASGLYAVVGGGNVNVSTGDYSTVGGGFTNTIASGSNYATIAGGKTNAITGPRGTISGGESNTSSGDVGVIGGGIGNSVTATGGSVLGGQNNSATAVFASVGGGQFNSATGPYGAVSGGASNSNSNSYGVIAGGNSNTITLAAFGAGSVIGGGLSNTLSNVSNTQGAVIAGGSSNTGGGAFSVISGGNQNDVPGAYSVVPGGVLNRASGDYSYAAGRRAKATAQGSFALADSQNTDLIVVDTDTLHVRFQGGAYFEVGASTFTGVLSIGGGANVMYYCTGSTAGTFDGNLARGNGNAGACAGGTWVATSLHTD